MSFAGIDVPANAVPLLGVELSFTIVAIVAVALRVVTRTCLIKNLGVDDLFIVLSAVRPFLFASWGSTCKRIRLTVLCSAH